MVAAFNYFIYLQQTARYIYRFIIYTYTQTLRITRFKSLNVHRSMIIVLLIYLFSSPKGRNSTKGKPVQGTVQNKKNNY